MAYSVAWSVEKVEATVAVEVEGFVLTDSEAFAVAIEVDFAESATFPSFLVHRRILVGWPSGNESAFETRSHDEICR